MHPCDRRDADSHAAADTEQHSERDAHIHSHAYIHTNTNTNANADIDTFADAKSVTERQHHSESNSKRKPHTIAHSHSDTFADSAASDADAITHTSAAHTHAMMTHAAAQPVHAEMQEREKYEGIYASAEKYPRYGHSNHGSRALPIVLKWFAETTKSGGSAQAINHQPPAVNSLIDIGCGWNEFCAAARAALPGINTVGVDFACPGADVTASATALPFADKHFDVLCAFDMLEHLLPTEVDAALAEFSRVSRRFIFSIAYEPSVTKWKGENLHPTVRGEPWWILRILHAGGCRIEKRGRYITGEWQPALRIHPDAKVILVGNGPSLLTHHGSQIDAFDEIVRFNTYHIDGFETHTGARTTLWSTFGRGQLPACGQRPDRLIYIHGENGEPAYAPRELYRVPRWFYNETRNDVQRRAWWMHGFACEPGRLLATSGLLVAAWLLEVVGVKKVTLAGFDHFSKDKSRQHHYWLPQAFGKPKEHDGAVEAAMFAELRDRGRIAYL